MTNEEAVPKLMQRAPCRCNIDAHYLTQMMHYMSSTNLVDAQMTQLTRLTHVHFSKTSLRKPSCFCAWESCSAALVCEHALLLIFMFSLFFLLTYTLNNTEFLYSVSMRQCST